MATTTNTNSKTARAGKHTSQVLHGKVKSSGPITRTGGVTRCVLTVETETGPVSVRASRGLAHEAHLAHVGEAITLTIEARRGPSEVLTMAFPNLGCQLTQDAKGVVREAPIK